MTAAEDDLEFDRMEREADYAFRLHLQVDWMPLPARVHFDPPLTEVELLRFSETNKIVWVEREADGAIYMRPIHPMFVAGHIADISGELWNWAERDGRGTCCGRAGWRLPDGSMRGAPISWIRNEKLNRFTKEEQKGFVSTAPDFIVEFMSAHSDRAYLEAKMEQWIANGVEVAWLIDSDRRMVTIYQQGEKARILADPTWVEGSGEILPVYGIRSLIFLVLNVRLSDEAQRTPPLSGVFILQTNQISRTDRMKIPAFHSINEPIKPADKRVYHNNSGCASGRDIPTNERRDGERGYRVCTRCKRLNAAIR